MPDVQQWLVPGWQRNFRFVARGARRGDKTHATQEAQKAARGREVHKI